MALGYLNFKWARQPFPELGGAIMWQGENGPHFPAFTSMFAIVSLKGSVCSQGVVVQEVSLVYRESARTGSKSTEKPCLKKQKTNKQKAMFALHSFSMLCQDSLWNTQRYKHTYSHFFNEFVQDLYLVITRESINILWANIIMEISPVTPLPQTLFLMLVSNSSKQGRRLVEEIGASLRLGELKGPYNTKRYRVFTTTTKQK